MRLSRVTTLAHMSAPDAFEDIFEHGLQTADQLVLARELPDAEWERLIRMPRPVFEHLPATDTHGPARLADNHPIVDNAALRASLAASGCTLADYCELLNTRVYFWPNVDFAGGTISGVAAGYADYIAQDGPFDIIRVRLSTLKRLAREQHRRVEVTRLNSGSSPRNLVERGPDTWTAIDAYPGDGPVREVTVVGGITGLAEVADVIRVRPGVAKLIWSGGRRR